MIFMQFIFLYPSIYSITLLGCISCVLFLKIYICAESISAVLMRIGTRNHSMDSLSSLSDKKEKAVYHFK